MFSKWSKHWILCFAGLVVTLSPTDFATTPSCNENFSDQTTGTIRSPGYPGTYKNGEFCNYAIKVPSGNKVNLTFLQASLERFGTHLVDYVLLFDGADCMARRIAAVVNMSTPTYVSSGNSMTALFISDATVIRGPFEAIFSAVSKQTATTKPMRPFPGNRILKQCGEELSGTSGNLSYKADNRNNQLCIWRITVGDGDRVELNVTKITIASLGDWFIVLDGEDCSAKLLYHQTGNVTITPYLITSTKNSMLVILSANTEGDFLEAFYNSTSTGVVTSTTLSASTGVVTSATLSAPWLSLNIWTTLISCLLTTALTNEIIVPE